MPKNFIYTEDAQQTEKQIRDNHFLDYLDYCEIKLLEEESEDSTCFRCGRSLTPLTFLDPNYYYLPCWDCSSKRKADRETGTESIVKAIKEFYSKILGDRYYQLFIVDDIYFKTTLPHTYSTFKKILNSMSPPSRSDIWFLDWNPGYPKIISQENIDGLKIVNLTDKYPIFENDKEKITVGDYQIVFPEFVTYEFRHFSRYSVLNKNGDRKSKRIRLGDKCVKLYNTEDPNTKSIFRLLQNGQEVSLRSLSYQDFVVIKMAIMRNKSFLKLVFDIIEELSKSIGTLRDSIFLKNSVVMNPKIDTEITMVWTYLSDYINEDNINISII